MKTILTTLLLFSSISVLCQDFKPVKRDDIEKAVTDENAPTYYPSLLERFKRFDDSLTVDDYRLLYYGFVFQDIYDGYNDDKAQEIREQIQKQNYKKAIKICDDVLEDLPISLSTIYLKAVALFRLDDKDSMIAKYSSHYRHLTEAILSSGNGLECKTAFKTVFVADEYELIYKYFEVEEFHGQALQTPCDVLSIKPAQKFNHGEIFFDTSETLLAMEKLFRKK